MKTLTKLSLENQVQDLVDLSNLLLNKNGTYIRYYDIQKDFPYIDKLLKKLNQFDRHFLLECIMRIKSKSDASGANMSGMLLVQGKLTPKKAKDIKASFASAFNIVTGQPD